MAAGRAVRTYSVVLPQRRLSVVTTTKPPTGCKSYQQESTMTLPKTLTEAQSRNGLAYMLMGSSSTSARVIRTRSGTDSPPQCFWTHQSTGFKKPLSTRRSARSENAALSASVRLRRRRLAATLGPSSWSTSLRTGSAGSLRWIHPDRDSDTLPPLRECPTGCLAVRTSGGP